MEEYGKVQQRFVVLLCDSSPFFLSLLHSLMAVRPANRQAPMIGYL
jgi:hypothetical protein